LAANPPRAEPFERNEIRRSPRLGRGGVHSRGVGQGGRKFGSGRRYSSSVNIGVSSGHGTAVRRNAPSSGRP